MAQLSIKKLSAKMERMGLTTKEKAILAKAAEVIVPKGSFFEAGGKKDAEKIAAWLEATKNLNIAYKAALAALEEFTRLRYPFRPFSQLPKRDRERVLQEWWRGGVVQRAAADLICETVKATHFDDEAIYKKIGCIWDKSAKQVEPERTMRQVQSAKECTEEVIECEAVVVGTGAGGAVVAKELAERGHAVLMIEEGKFWTRKDFSGRFLDAAKKFYHNSGANFALGNTLIPIPLGKMVGGSTAINTGTCWRTPQWILKRWVAEFGLKNLSYEKLLPYFERVEAILQVEEAKPKVVGGIASVIGRGCNELGYRHFPLRRNAPECDGQGVCNFGCPTDARRSTNVSYVPLALRAGAQLLTEARATEVLTEKGRAVGVAFESTETGKTIRVHAKIVVLACGSIMTPALLLKQGICQESRALGQNLTLHPAVTVCALFEKDPIDSYRFAPQGYCVDTFHRQGILLLGAGLPLDAGASALQFIGKRFAKVMSQFPHIASFGAMVEDRPSGRVFLHRGKPRIFYWLRKKELSLLKRGVDILCQIYLVAGAKEVYPLVREVEAITSERELEAFQERTFPPSSFRIASFHPLGTCRMGRDPHRSVVSEDHETHSIKNLFICDGSVLPSSIAVNPQETIMALSTRAAEGIAKRI